MITRVEDSKGNALHDCKEAGCTVSWDGYQIADGQPVQGRQDPDPKAWVVQRGTARLRADAA